MTLNKGEVAVPFLKDHEIQKDFLEEAKDAMMEEEDSKSEDEKVHELMLMGYDEKQCKLALKQANGNLQLAASILGNM